MLARIIFFFALLSFVLGAHICDHNKRNKTTLHHIASTDPSNIPDQGRMLQDTYQSIRIFADYTYLTNGTAQQIDYIKNQIMASAIQYYQGALKIQRLSTTLQSNLSCGEYDAPGYLKNTGVAADLVILVAAQTNPGSGYVASAMPCGLSLVDDRPVYGLMLFNLPYVLMNTVTDDQENLSTALHEIAHILGFNNALYQFFRDPLTGQALSAPPTGFKTINGVNISYINVEPLTTKVRTYFNCSTLEGAYLENGGSASSAGSHFERRVFMNEYMTASSITEPVISEFTLALLEGSGWYKSDYTLAEPFTWGKGEGCPFLEGSCINGQGDPNYREFCDLDNQKGCTFTGRGIGFCLQGQYEDPFADSCPYFLSAPDFDCENLVNQANTSFTGEKFGAQSRCFTGTLKDFSNSSSAGSYCLPISCVKSGSNYSLTVTVGTQNVACTKVESISVSGFSGILNCPEPNDYCARANPVFCEKGCSGRGQCVSGQCQCSLGWSGADCAQRINSTNCGRCASGVCYGDQCGVKDQSLDSPIINAASAALIVLTIPILFFS